MSWGKSLSAYLWRQMQAKFVFLNSERFLGEKKTRLWSHRFFFFFYLKGINHLKVIGKLVCLEYSPSEAKSAFRFIVVLFCDRRIIFLRQVGPQRCWLQFNEVCARTQDVMSKEKATSACHWSEVGGRSGLSGNVMRQFCPTGRTCHDQTVYP